MQYDYHKLRLEWRRNDGVVRGRTPADKRAEWWEPVKAGLVGDKAADVVPATTQANDRIAKAMSAVVGRGRTVVKLRGAGQAAAVRAGRSTWRRARKFAERVGGAA